MHAHAHTHAHVHMHTRTCTQSEREREGGERGGERDRERGGERERERGGQTERQRKLDAAKRPRKTISFEWRRFKLSAVQRQLADFALQN